MHAIFSFGVTEEGGFPKKGINPLLKGLPTYLQVTHVKVRIPDSHN